MSLILIYNLLFLDKMKLSHSLCLICSIYFIHRYISPDRSVYFIHWYISPVRSVYFLKVFLYVLVNCLQKAYIWFVKCYMTSFISLWTNRLLGILFSMCRMHLILWTIDWPFVFVLLSCLFLDVHLLFTSFGVFTPFIDSTLSWLGTRIWIKIWNNVSSYLFFWFLCCFAFSQIVLHVTYAVHILIHIEKISLEKKKP